MNNNNTDYGPSEDIINKITNLYNNNKEFRKEINIGLIKFGFTIGIGIFILLIKCIFIRRK